MFDRFIRLARARKSLREGRFFDALRQAADPVVEADRRAEELRRRAAAAALERAEQRLARGDVAAARRDAQQLRALEPHAAVDALLARCDEAAATASEAAAARRAAQREFRALLDGGALARAEALLATLPADEAGLAGMREEVTLRRRRAAAVLAEAASCAEESRCEAAISAYQQALALDGAPIDAAHGAARRKIAAALHAELEATLRDAPASAAALVDALERYGEAARRVPSLDGEDLFRESGRALAAAAMARLRVVPGLDEGARLGRALRASGVSLGDAADRAVEAVVAAGGDEAGAGALLPLLEACDAAGFAGLARTVTAAVAAADGRQQQLAAARASLEEGDLERARARFVEILAEEPLHPAAQQELELLDEALADQDRRLADARAALRAGKLREACALTLALAGTPRIAAEAQQLSDEARERTALVETGLDEVRVALHSRASGSLEGVRHCLGRLRELGRVQVDHEQLPALVAAVEAEIDGLERCAAAVAALATGDLGPAVTATPALVAARRRLLHAERIDARLAELGDAVLSHGERAQESGRLDELARAADLLAALEIVRPAFGARAAEWREQRAAREARVAALLTRARERAAADDGDEVARLLSEARGLWRDSAEVRQVADELRRQRRQESALSEAAEMTRAKDYAGAQDKLRELAGADPSLRTRVFDIQRDLVRAQGLEGAFLLRVDEGGEHLVVRGETLTIGNVRHGRADLPVLASLAGRHASIRRSMSFHGGMEDVVVAEEGEVRVGGAPVQRRALRGGEVVQLGAALRARYERPTARSLTSRLILQGGFQVAGTDRVLLMKDRGRDGRILIGAGRDLHVPVDGARGEVAIYAHSSGQVRVACEQGGSIDGVPFTGEHPVAAGEVVEAAGVTLVLMPWTHPGGARGV